MGQKINPNIFRLGVSKTWKTAYFENNSKELPLHIHKDNDFVQFIVRYLSMSGIVVHDINYNFNHSTFIVYISYFVSPLFRIESNGFMFQNRLVLSNKYSNIKKSISYDLESINLNAFHASENITNLIYSKSQLYKVKSLFDLKLYNKFYLSHINTNLFLLRLNHILNLFLGKNNRIVLCFNCINKDSSYLKNLSRNEIKVLKRFNRLPVFKESVELFLYIVSNRRTSGLLATFLSQQFQKTKRQNFFLKFIRQVFSVLLRSSFSKYKGIKILVRGRLNGVPRAKHKTISIGDIPVTSIHTNLDYSQTFCHNSNGSYGIKIWMAEK